MYFFDDMKCVILLNLYKCIILTIIFLIVLFANEHLYAIKIKNFNSHDKFYQ